MPRFIVRFDATLSAAPGAPLPSGTVIPDPGVGGYLVSEPEGTWRYGRIEIDAASVTVTSAGPGVVAPTIVTFTNSDPQVFVNDDLPVLLTSMGTDGDGPIEFSVVGDGLRISGNEVWLDVMPPAGDMLISVEAANSAGTVTSDFTLSAIADTVAPTITRAPTISGDTFTGGTLTADVGAATGSPAPTSAVQWFNDGAAKGTAATQVSDGPGAWTVQVTWSNGVGSPASATSPKFTVTDQTRLRRESDGSVTVLSVTAWAPVLTRNTDGTVTVSEGA